MFEPEVQPALDLRRRGRPPDPVARGEHRSRVVGGLREAGHDPGVVEADRAGVGLQVGEPLEGTRQVVGVGRAAGALARVQAERQRDGALDDDG
nr:hypothetical protein [Saccharopolyspora sp. 6T]